MADKTGQTSGELRAAKLSSSLDQSLLNRSASVQKEDNPEDAGEELSAPGEDHANLREQMNQARQQQAAQNGGAGTSTMGGMGSAIGGSMLSGKKAVNPEEIVKKKLKQAIIRSVLAPLIGGCCFPGFLIAVGVLATAALLLTIIDDPLKFIDLFGLGAALKAIGGTVAGWFGG